ncbi:MAG TPA: hypothetical protein VJ732_07350 [Bryobacteraceae bacterium]|nr:hypothetical protein [Bryobacteraceae bacterium]
MRGTLIHLAFRGWVGNELRFCDRVALPEAALEKIVPALARKHAQALAREPHMLEIEFLDEPNPQERFFRFGTDPRRMVEPIAIDLGGKVN